TSLTDTAQVTSATTDPAADNNTDSLDTAVQTRADLAVTQKGPATVIAGTNATFTIPILNTGPSDAQDVTLSDTLPAGATFVSASQGSGSGNHFSAALGTLAAGSSTTVTLVVHINSDATGSLQFSAGASSTTADTDMSNNTGPAAITVDTRADLAVTLAA